MSEILIHNHEDLRPGDVLRVRPQSSPEQWAEGPICEMGSGALMVGGLFIRWKNGAWALDRFDLTEYPARREAPPLPTEAGSVVRVTGLRGERLREPRVGVRVVGDTLKPWWVSGYSYYRAGDITGWVPLTVTEAGPEVTR